MNILQRFFMQYKIIFFTHIQRKELCIQLSLR